MLRPSGFGDAMAETTEELAGIYRCPGKLHTLFALTLMEQGKFEWRTQNDHEWEVGRWPGLQLTLLAKPQWGRTQPQFAICPFPGRDGTIPFIVLVVFAHDIDSSYSATVDTLVSVLTLTTLQIQRDAKICAHQVFDAAVWLQLPSLEASYMRVSRRPNLPCMKSMMEKQYPFTAPAPAIHIGGLPMLLTFE